MRHPKITKAAQLAIILINHHSQYAKRNFTPWSTAYALENLFGVDPTSSFPSIKAAVMSACESPWPAPFAQYEFEKHTIHIRNGDLLTRPVKLCELPPNMPVKKKSKKA